jgi:serine/threonine protein kinase
VLYRDLKPDNLLLDADGHLRLSDFGVAVILDHEGARAQGGAGTQGYQAPEVLARQTYDYSVDVWSYGVTLYELMHRRRPFRRRDKQAAAALKEAKDLKEREAEKPVAEAINAVPQIAKKTPPLPQASAKQEKLAPSAKAPPVRRRVGVDDYNFNRIAFSNSLSNITRDFLQGLLTVNISERLGCGPTRWEEVKRHPFFRNIDWDKIANKEIMAPVQPDPLVPNYDTMYEMDELLLEEKAPPKITAAQDSVFADFGYNATLDANGNTAHFFDVDQIMKWNPQFVWSTHLKDMQPANKHDKEFNSPDYSVSNIQPSSSTNVSQASHMTSTASQMSKVRPNPYNPTSPFNSRSPRFISISGHSSQHQGNNLTPTHASQQLVAASLETVTLKYLSPRVSQTVEYRSRIGKHQDVQAGHKRSQSRSHVAQLLPPVHG